VNRGEPRQYGSVPRLISFALSFALSLVPYENSRKSLRGVPTAAGGASGRSARKAGFRATMCIDACRYLGQARIATSTSLCVA
jgi:hypothetical protein